MMMIRMIFVFCVSCVYVVIKFKKLLKFVRFCWCRLLKKNVVIKVWF